MGFSVSVEVDVEVGRLFDFVADPANRPRWQSSLRAVEVLTAPPARLGTRWYDVTWLGVRPLLEITGWEQNVRWVEVGRWRGLEVVLDLVFTPVAEERTRVRATAVTRAPGWRRPLGWGLDRFGPAVARNDLRRAARVC